MPSIIDTTAAGRIADLEAKVVELEDRDILGRLAKIEAQLAELMAAERDLRRTIHTTEKGEQRDEHRACPA